MDKEIRNHIQRATQGVRTLLESEYAEQLEGLFDIRLNGAIADLPGEHLDGAQRVLRAKLVAAITHGMAGGMSPAEAVGSYLREAAFTSLNRFVALKMLEARRLVQECVSKWGQSSGFKEFTGLAPGLLQLSDRGYRLYIESLFDEIGREVKVLFDRRDPASLLWPRRQALQDVFGILNATELASVWNEDETIGWVYQYFNSNEERRQMRAESQAPRNSRELAVRNQFFTPRYVVQFLTDNTLGQLWYEMRQGETKLANLGFLVRRPNEVFLAEGEDLRTENGLEERIPLGEGQIEESVCVPFRQKKDPRDLRVLDPACGSGHFLLYAFDLLLTIYEEAWADRDSPRSDKTGRTLGEDYPDLTSLRSEVPGLILHHNLHGVDIDARCAQIAGLALWMRAHRAYEIAGIGRHARPPIQKTNIVVAEPMPGEKDLRKEFIESLEPKLGKLVERVFTQMELAGEIGSALRAEYELTNAVRDVYNEHGELFQVLDEERWACAEKALLVSLQIYAGQTNNGRAFQRRLFCEDASHGLGFINICREKYDAVLMNPPFGDSAKRGNEYTSSRFVTGSADLGAVFVIRGLELLDKHGKLGAITNRTLLAIQGFTNWRAEVLNNAGLHVFVDLGHGVLDAMVETAMYICGESSDHETILPSAFLGLLDSSNKERDLLEAMARGNSFKWRNSRDFSVVPGAPWAYWVPLEVLRRFEMNASFLSSGGLVCQGTATADDFRFYRLRWEVQQAEIHVAPHRHDRGFHDHRWSPIAKGGEYMLWWDDIHLVQDWSNDGGQIKNFVTPSGKPRSFPKNLDKLFRRGTTYPRRTTSAFGLRLLPAGLSFSVGGWAVLVPDGWTDEEVLATYNSRPARYFMEVLLGQGDSSSSGTAARNHGAAPVGGIPWPRIRRFDIRRDVKVLVDNAALRSNDETTVFFSGRRHFDSGASAWNVVLESWWNAQCTNWLETSSTFARVEEAAISSYRLSDTELLEIDRAEGRSLTSYPEKEVTAEEVVSLFQASVEELTSRAKKSCGAKRYIVKKAYFVNRVIDLGCHILGVHPASIIEAARATGARECGEEKRLATALLSWILGVAVGNRDPNASVSEGPSCLDALPRSGYEETGTGITKWVDDPGHELDIAGLVRQAANKYWKSGGEQIIEEAVTKIGRSNNLREWLRNEFFAYHISTYSKSRRKAPIYWQLSVPSSAYAIWLNYQQLTRDTFYKVGNDFVTAKLQYEERKLGELQGEDGADLSASQRRKLGMQENFVVELRAFRDEVALVAPLWNPDLNDGVIINFAPLWRLVSQNRSWQKECKKVWDKLVAGDYDWAHLAMHLWPERVVPKCAKDRSLAIAHGLENTFWHEDVDGKWHHRMVQATELQTLIIQRMSPAVQEALKNLLEAPTPMANRMSRRSSANTTITRTRSASQQQDTAGSRHTSSPRAHGPIDEDLLKRVRTVVAAYGGGSSKADVIDATGITSAEWNKAIKTLLADGTVRQSGERRGARYHASGGDG